MSPPASAGAPASKRRGASSGLWRLALVVISSFTTFTVVSTLVPILAVRAGANEVLVGTLSATVWFLPLFLATFAGSLVDRWGTRRMITFAVAAHALAPLAAVVAPTMVALFATQVAIGLGNLFLVVGGQAYTAGLGEGARRDSNFGWYTMFISAGQFLGPLLGGFVADLTGARGAFAVASTVSLLGVAAAWTLVEPGRGEPKDDAVAPRLTWGRSLSYLTDRSIGYAIFVTFLVAGSQSIHLAFFPVALESAAYATGVIGAFLSLRALISMSIRPFTARIVRVGGGHSRALLWMVACVGGAMLVLAVSREPWAAATSSVLFGVGFGVAPPLSVVMVVNRVRSVERGVALGVRLTVNRLAQLSAPLAFGVLAQGLSVPRSFLGTGVALIGIAVFGEAWRRRFRP